jgi:hypothetical protein
VGDALAGTGDDLDQEAQVGVDAAGSLFLDEVAGQGNGFHGVRDVGEVAHFTAPEGIIRI